MLNFAVRPMFMYRNFKVFGRSQLLLATGHVHTVVHCQSPSGDGSYLCMF